MKGKSKKHVLWRKLTYGFLAIAFILACFLVYSSLNPSDQTPDHQTQQPKAAILDQLSALQPNESFKETSKAILETAGFTVHYYGSYGISVEFYRKLPFLDFDFIILRVHSALGTAAGRPTDLALFTSEPYSKTAYLHEQLIGTVVPVKVFEGGSTYFGINREFVESSMESRFNNTTIIMMGCDGLTYTSMAEAFIKRGANVYIGWNGLVAADHTDLATTRLLHHLIIEKKTIEKSVTEAINEVGPDPSDGSILKFYPDPEAADYIVPHGTDNMDLDRSLKDVFYSAVWFGDEKDPVSRLHSTCIQQWNVP